MKITVINPETDAATMTRRYISALYGCSLVEFARKLEREKIASLKAVKAESVKEVGD